jgi:hypothetical protein
MASTRAKARVMRDFCNIGMCSFDELNPDDMEAELATLSQITLIKKLAAELNEEVECSGLTKDTASRLINDLTEKKTGNILCLFCLHVIICYSIL